MSAVGFVFVNGGVIDNDMVVPYCGTGIWAANIYIAARHLGYDTKFYDGSFHEWSDEEMEIEKPVKRGLFR